MSDIDFGQISEVLNNKTDRDLRNVDTTAKADAVIDWQAPTAENDYTWYRKYASGWVEQGGIKDSARTHPTSATLTVSLPVEMCDTNYILIVKSNNRIATTTNTLTEQYANSDFGTAGAKTTTSFTCRGYQPSWYVCGCAAA